jgi:hypothetical protein
MVALRQGAGAFRECPGTDAITLQIPGELLRAEDPASEVRDCAGPEGNETIHEDLTPLPDLRQDYSTVTLLARLRGWSTSQPRLVAIS